MNKKDKIFKYWRKKKPSFIKTHKITWRLWLTKEWNKRVENNEKEGTSLFWRILFKDCWKLWESWLGRGVGVGREGKGCSHRKLWAFRFAGAFLVRPVDKYFFCKIFLSNFRFFLFRTYFFAFRSSQDCLQFHCHIIFTSSPSVKQFLYSPKFTL